MTVTYSYRGISVGFEDKGDGGPISSTEPKLMRDAVLILAGEIAVNALEALQYGEETSTGFLDCCLRKVQSESCLEADAPDYSQVISIGDFFGEVMSNLRIYVRIPDPANQESLEIDVISELKDRETSDDDIEQGFSVLARPYAREFKDFVKTNFRLQKGK